MAETHLRTALPEEFHAVRAFYWNLIDRMKDQSETIGWKKGIYPTDEYLRESIAGGELYVLDGEDGFASCVIVNHSWNEGYESCPWRMCCRAEEILVPHALAIDPALQGTGIGKAVIRDIITMARSRGMKAVRLDI